MMSSPEPLTALEERTWHELVQVSVLLLTRLDQELREYGLSLGEYEVLAFLDSSQSRRMRMTDLARQVLVSKSNLTTRVARLEVRGEVTRVTDVLDRRVQWAVLTPRGRAVLRRAYASHLEGVRRYVMAPVGRDLPTLDRSLAEILSAVSGHHDEDEELALP